MGRKAVKVRIVEAKEITFKTLKGGEYTLYDNQIVARMSKGSKGKPDEYWVRVYTPSTPSVSQPISKQTYEELRSIVLGATEPLNN